MAALIPFFDWLAKQKNQRTSLGSFARDAARDPGFPRDMTTLEALLDYVRASPGASPQNVAVARSAYRAYERAHSAAPRA
jgi:hypothetical protein